MEQDTNNIPELQSPFEQLREAETDGKEWWNSRKLTRVMGYGKYWNSEHSSVSCRLYGCGYDLQQNEESGEIHLSDTIRKIRTPSDKWSGEVMMYNLDAVIAVAYRVNRLCQTLIVC